MIRSKKTALCLTLTLAILVNLLSGCRHKKPNSEENNTDAPSTSMDSSALTEAAAETEMNSVLTEAVAETEKNAVMTEAVAETEKNAVTTEVVAETEKNLVTTEAAAETEKNAVTTEAVNDTEQNIVMTISEETSSDSAELTSFLKPNVVSAIKELDPIQINSVFMLNYLAVMTQQIIDASNNRLNLEEIYSILENYTKRSAVNEETKDQIVFLFDAIRDYRTLSHKRDRLLYMYQQNQAQALHQAIPNPVGILSAVSSKGWKGAAVSAIYMAIDSYTSYKSFVAENDLNYLLADWELDDSEEEVLYSLRGENFSYLVDMTNKYDLPDELVMNKKSSEEFIGIKQEENPKNRIILLEEKKDVYQGLAEYWLVLAQSYYDQATSKNGTPKDYQKCLEAIETYIALPASIVLKDRPLAKALTMAIAAAEETLDGEEYITAVNKYANMIIDNTETSDWELRYYAALTFAELYERTRDVEHLNMAYRVARLNAIELMKTQQKMNDSYTEDIQKLPVPEPKVPKKPTNEEQEQIDDITQYNNQLEDERKTALPPIYEPLLLNCELLLEISRSIDFTSEKRNELDEIFHANDSNLFMIPTVDNIYRFSIEPTLIEENDITIGFENGRELKIPAMYISDGFTIKVAITDPETEETKLFDDWNVVSVDREKKNDVSEFTAKLVSESIKDFKYKVGMEVEVFVISAANCTPMPLIFEFDVENAKDDFIEMMGFWNRNYTVKRKQK